MIVLCSYNSQKYRWIRIERSFNFLQVKSINIRGSAHASAMRLNAMFWFTRFAYNCHRLKLFDINTERFFNFEIETVHGICDVNKARRRHNCS